MIWSSRASACSRSSDAAFRRRSRSSKWVRATDCRTSARRSAPPTRSPSSIACRHAGHQVIEVSAFVSPKWVPQMADAAEVFAGIARRPGVRDTRRWCRISKGLERAIAAGVSEVAIFAAASETFSRRNINQSIDESLATYAAVCADAQAAGLAGARLSVDVLRLPVRRPDRSAARGRDFRAAARHRRLRSRDQRHDRRRASRRMFPCPRSRQRSACLSQQIALHFHDTRGTALANVLAGLDYGVTTFDSSAGGLGGCPFAPGRRGQPRHGRSAVHAERPRHRDRRVDRRRRGRLARSSRHKLDHALPSRYLQAPTLTRLNCRTESELLNCRTV